MYYKALKRARRIALTVPSPAVPHVLDRSNACNSILELTVYFDFTNYEHEGISLELLRAFREVKCSGVVTMRLRISLTPPRPKTTQRKLSSEAFARVAMTIKDEYDKLVKLRNA